MTEDKTLIVQIADKWLASGTDADGDDGILSLKLSSLLI